MSEVSITIGKGVYCKNLPKGALKKVKKNLTFKNPQYVSAIKRGAFIPADMPAELYLFDIEDSECWLPRGYIFYLLKFLKRKKHKYKIYDHTLLHKPLNLKFHGKLKPYQVKANKQMMKYPVGVLEGGTGSGKTVVGIHAITVRQQPTLIIVHSKELLYQWRDQIKVFLHYDCGLVGDQNFSIKPITVAIINSVNNHLDELTPHFGHIIIDECHRISAESWSGTLQAFAAKYYLGLTATAYRRDGLGHAIFASIGPKIHTIDKKMLYDTKAILRPDVYKIRSKFKYLFADDYSTMISKLTKDEARNRLICSVIARDLKRYKENIVVVSDRKHHCISMREMLLNEFGIQGEVLTGAKNKKARKELTAKIKAGKCKVVFATLSLIGEGFDAPNLAVLFLTTPVKFAGRLVQVCGRVLRFVKGKVPRIYDVRDDNVNVLRYSGYARDRVYKKEWGK